MFQCSLNILNFSNFQLKKSNLESNSMKKWDESFPELIFPFKKIVLYVEYHHTVCCINQYGSGRVDYTLTGGELSPADLVTFTIITRVIKCKPALLVYWNSVGQVKNLCLMPYSTAAPSYPSQIGWVAGGNVVLAILQHKETISQRSLYLDAGTSEGWASQWMAIYRPVLGGLCLMPNRDNKAYLTLPGTHDSGTYCMQYFWTSPWTRTQSSGLYAQLMTGCRSLDFRTGFCPGMRGDERFMLVHDIFSTRLSLRNALDAVKEFSKSHPTEVIVLDFHHFVNMRTHVMRLTAEVIDEIIALTKDCLNGLLIPRCRMRSSLSEIWQHSQRIIAAFNTTTRDDDIWPGVDQLWAGPYVTLKPALQEFLRNTFSNELPEGIFSSAESVLPAIVPLSYKIFERPIWVPTLTPELSLWYSPGSSWAEKANIIAVDFIEKTNLPQLAVTSSLLKGCKLGQATTTRQTDG